jgi:hypothetical protein
MKKFITDSLKFFALFATVSILFFSSFLIFSEKESSQSYHAAIYDKHARLEKLGSPKIILLGGSNLTFSVDSKMLHDSLGYEVVNMSLHAGYGLHYMLNEVKENIGENDIVIAAPEYDLFLTSSHYGDATTAELLFVYPQGAGYFDQPFGLITHWKPCISISQGMVKRFVRNTQKSNDGVYSRDAFNEYGDDVGHLQAESFFANEKHEIRCLEMENFNEATLAELSDFASLIKSKKARFFISCPSLAASVYDSVGANVIFKKLSDAGLPVISHPDEYVFADTLIYDTRYHLNAQGRESRTKKLIGDLRVVF